MATFKHNKKRNTGLVYEFLVRRLGQAMIDQDRDAYRKTLEIMRKHYGDGTLLCEERELFEVVRNARGLTEASARRVLAEVQRHARVMDARKIDIKKSCLIKDTNHALGQGFFAEHRVPDYRLLASIQMMIDASRREDVLAESIASIQIEEGLVQYMTTKGGYAVRLPAQSEVDQVVMRMVSKRFGEKYSKSLNDPQKRLLEKFVRFQVVGDAEPLEKFLAEEGARIRVAIDRARLMKEVREDRVMLERLDEAVGHFPRPGSLEERVEHTMLYQKLAEEIDADE